MSRTRTTRTRTTRTTRTRTTRTRTTTTTQVITRYFGRWPQTKMFYGKSRLPRMFYGADFLPSVLSYLTRHCSKSWRRLIPIVRLMFFACMLRAVT